jgi:aspartate/methionine/tyrosine aminotransferase
MQHHELDKVIMEKIFSNAPPRYRDVILDSARDAAVALIGRHFDEFLEVHKEVFTQNIAKTFQKLSDDGTLECGVNPDGEIVYWMNDSEGNPEELI